MPMVGETLAGRYRIDAALGAGATAVVYRAHDLRLARDVAVKVLLPNLARDSLIAGRFDREARALAAAANPGIVAVYDVDRGDPETGREPFFVMELCDGGSLADALHEEGGRLSPDVLIPMLAPIAGGLASLHARGVIHRDVKPHNILLCGSGAKLADFGLALAQDTTRLTAAGTGAGTLAYLAPELLGGSEPTPAADMYALGVVTFQGLTGRLPRASGSMVDLVDARHAPVPPVSVAAPELGRSFDGVVGAALAPDPVRRPSPPAFAGGLWQGLDGWRTATRDGSVAALAAGSDASTQQIRLPRGSRGMGNGRSDGRSRHSLLGPIVAAAALGVLAAVIVLVLVSAGLGGPGPAATASPRPTARPTVTTSPSPTPTASPTASPTGSASPSPSPTPRPTPSPTPAPVITPVPTPIPTNPPVWSLQQARGALANLDQAIQNAQDTLRIARKDAMDLRHAADAVDKALGKDDNGQSAARAAQMLDQQVQQKIAEGKLSDTGELQQAVATLRGALPPVQ